MALLVASKLSKPELIELSELLDGDSQDEFNRWIQASAAAIAPELFIDVSKIRSKRSGTSSRKKKGKKEVQAE